MRSRRLTPLEADSQAAFFDWWTVFARSHRLPECLCFAVPNGAKLPWRKDRKGRRYSPEAKNLLKQGMRPGVPDVHLDIPAGGFHGLRLEFKRVGEDVRSGSAQEAHIDALRLRGYNALIVKSTEEAVKIVRAYLQFADRPEDRVPMRS